ncbi:hypothetical protein B0I31_104192 [Saccharothrix carnea]|uniref:Syndecan 1 n=1 Tax=Saccharothrix carnea TaxID=1280637 RepID=A0A2P8IBQ8_SACCR|nr:hypothetical protein B0I31_104192 [Saccharothrix carnea]
MGFWDRFRRRPTTAAVSSVAVPAPARRPGWDGGWRATRPMEGVIQRAGIAVGDGLRFRGGLAAWQDHALGGRLGHAVLPGAPAGVVHGVARHTGEPGEYAGNDQLTVALRNPDLTGTPSPEPTGTTGPAVQRSPATPVPVRPLGRPLTVAHREVTPLRSVPVARTTTQAAEPTPAPVQRQAPGPPAGESGSAPLLGELVASPVVPGEPASRATADALPVPVLRSPARATSAIQPPPAPAGPARIQRQEAASAPGQGEPAAPVIGGPTAPPMTPAVAPRALRSSAQAPVQRTTRTGPTLGEPLAHLPATAVVQRTPGNSAPPVQIPTDTVVQRRTDIATAPLLGRLPAEAPADAVVQRETPTRPVHGQPPTQAPADSVVQRKSPTRPVHGQPPAEAPADPVVQRVSQSPLVPSSPPAEIQADTVLQRETPTRPVLGRPAAEAQADTVVQRETRTPPVPGRLAAQVPAVARPAPVRPPELSEPPAPDPTRAVVQRKSRTGPVLGEPLARIPADAVVPHGSTAGPGLDRQRANVVPARAPLGLGLQILSAQPAAAGSPALAPQSSSPRPSARTRLPVVRPARPAVQRHTPTAPLLADRPLISSTTPAMTTSTPSAPEKRQAVPVRWSSPAREGSAAQRSPSKASVQRAAVAGPVTPAPRTAQRAVVRPATPAEVDEATPGRPIVPAYPPVVVAPPRPAGQVPAAPTIRPATVQRSVTVQRSPDQPVKSKAATDKTATGTPHRLERSDLDDLARRLLEPVGRLLRAELRHGRERTGLLHDRRR